MDTNNQTVRVSLQERGYDIQIGSENLGSVGEFVTGLRDVSHAMVITDNNVESPHAKRVVESLAGPIARVDTVVVPAGEASKSLREVERVLEKMLELGADRKSVVVAVGGGVIGDLAGFVAATYARGLDFVQVPTTLLAQVDSSVGGKTGVNLPNAKNMVGAFWQPIGVLIDTQVLDTLPRREFASGLAEVVKYGVILDADFFHYLEEHHAAINDRDAATMRYVIARCCRLKADVVEQDERETSGLRAVLNYGHTFCHAIEAETGYGQFLHGEAVAIGMMCAARLAEKLGRIDQDLRDRQLALLRAFDLPVSVPAVSHDALIRAMQRDKKVEHGRLRFVLPARIGHVELVSDVPETLVRETLSELT